MVSIVVEDMGCIQQIFADNRPPGLLAYLELALLKTVVDAVMSLTDPPLGQKDRLLQLLYLSLGQLQREFPASEVPKGMAEVFFEICHSPASPSSVSHF